MKHLTLKIWLGLIGLHVLLSFPIPLINADRPTGTLLVYFTVGLLGKAGLPVWIDPMAESGWPSPNVFGWSLGAAVWISIYLGAAWLVARAQRHRFHGSAK